MVILLTNDRIWQISGFMLGKSWFLKIIVQPIPRKMEEIQFLGCNQLGSQPKASSSKGKIALLFSYYSNPYKDHSMLTSSMHLMRQNSLPKT